MQDNTHQNSQLLQFSDEILLHILYFLDVKTIGQLSVSSKLLARICNDDSIWKNKLLEENLPLPKEKNSVEPNFYRNYFNKMFQIRKNYLNHSDYLNILLVGDKQIDKKTLLSNMCSDTISQNFSLNGHHYCGYITSISEISVRIFDITGKESEFDQIATYYNFIDGIICAVDTCCSSTYRFMPKFYRITQLQLSGKHIGLLGLYNDSETNNLVAFRILEDNLSLSLSSCLTSKDDSNKLTQFLNDFVLNTIKSISASKTVDEKEDNPGNAVTEEHEADNHTKKSCCLMM